MSMEAVKEMLGYAQHQSYRDSSVPELGRIPTEWGTIRLKYGATINDDALNGSEDPDMEIQYVDITSVEFGRGIVAKETMRFGDSPSRARRLVRDGDVIVSTVRTYLKSIAPIVRPDTNLVVSTGFAVLRPSTYRPEFLRYVLESEFFLDEVAKRSVGVSYPGINASQLGDIFGVLPPSPEQTRIAAFLDRKCGQIDTAIAQKERLIALLKERRQVLVQQAVTKGLNPNAKMKDSGVAWLGEVPEHWEVRRLKYILGERVEKSIDGREPLLMMSQEHGLVVRSEFHDKAEVAQSTVGAKRVYPSDLVFNKLKAHLGVFFKSAVDHVGIVSPDYAVYHSVAHVEDLKYLELLFRIPAYIEQFIHRSRGIVEGLTRLYTSDLFEMQVTVPPDFEQRAILDHVDEYTRKNDLAVKDMYFQIAKLKEYRSILINAAVTGKIKVPEASAFAKASASEE